MQLGWQRLQSGSLASCSGRPLTAQARPQVHRWRPTSSVCRASSSSAAVDEGEQEDDGYVGVDRAVKASFFTLKNPNNREPNYADPDWYEKVSNWSEFWNDIRWELETEDDEGFDDNFDVDGNPTRTTERALRMLAAFRQVEARPDVENIVTSQSRRDHTSVYDDPPVPPETQPELPPWDDNDFRAFAEKQRNKELMDIEWRTRQSKVGKLRYPHMDVGRDVRLRQFDYLDETLDWPEERVRALITQNGTAADPANHKGFVENPLIPVDFVNTMGVTHIEEVEDFIERMGHMADKPQMEHLSREVVEDLLNSSTLPHVAASMLEPILEDMEAHNLEAMRRFEGNTWMGDDEH